MNPTVTATTAAAPPAKLAEQVYTALKAELHDFHWVAGDRFSEAEIVPHHSRWLLPPIDTGKAQARIADRAPGGSDLQSIRATARREGDELIIGGWKVFTTNVQGAEVMRVACKTNSAVHRPQRRKADMS